jgi:hypothetical protein
MTDLGNKLENLITDAMKANLTDKTNWPFSDPEDFRKKSGKRFRVTKEQVKAGTTRDEAFAQFIQQLMSKK